LAKTAKTRPNLPQNIGLAFAVFVFRTALLLRGMGVTKTAPSGNGIYPAIVTG